MRDLDCRRQVVFEAAEILGISPHTVDYYLSAAGRKLNTVNRVHTVATALRLRLLR